MSDLKLTLREALELVRDCSSQEWQQPDGKRNGATDNQGRRMWFITEDVIKAVNAALNNAPGRPSLRWDGYEVWGDFASLDAARRVLATRGVALPDGGKNG